MPDQINLTEAALLQILELASMNQDTRRWVGQHSSFARSTLVGVRLRYEKQIRPTLEPYRGRIRIIDDLMSAHEAVTESIEAASPQNAATV